MPQPAIGQSQTPEFVFHPGILWLGVLWGFAEATFFFIVPDVLLTLVALYSWRRSAQLLASILLGALAGGTAMFYFGAKAEPQAKAVVLQVPFVSRSMFVNTRQGFERNGIWTLVRGPGNGIPYKVYCVQASRYANWGTFIVISVLARLERFAPFWVVAAVLGTVFRKQIQRRQMIPALIHVSLWILGYAWYWSRIG
jgi:membrane protein YqaA with SNARE-associated domain